MPDQRPWLPRRWGFLSWQTAGIAVVIFGDMCGTSWHSRAHLGPVPNPLLRELNLSKPPKCNIEVEDHGNFTEWVRVPRA